MAEMKVYRDGDYVIVDRGAPFVVVTMPFTDSRVIEWVGSEDLGVHDSKNTITYKENYDNIKDRNGGSYGNTFEEVRSALTAVTTEFLIVNVPAMSEVETIMLESNFGHARSEIHKERPQIPVVGITDTGNVSSGGNENRLKDGNLTNESYNNLSPGTINKGMHGIDLGSSLLVGLIRVYWFNLDNIALQFKIQGSNDGSAWTDETGTLIGAGAGLQNIPVNATWRYWRVFCILGANASFCTMSEMEAYEVVTEFDYFINSSEEKVSIKVNVDDDKIIVKNNTDELIEVILNFR